MYDELISALRNNADHYGFVGDNGLVHLLTNAADAIEAMCEMVATAHIELANVIQSYEESKPRWIPVTERLPEDIDEEVLVCTEDYGVSGLGFVTVATYGVSGWLECWERKTYLTAVTHWMPLPTPPQAEESE